MIRTSNFEMKSRWIGVVALILCATVAWGHAILVTSNPQANSVVSGPKIDIALRFNVRVDSARSLIRLVSADGSSTTVPLLPEKVSNVIAATASNVKPGKYKLAWQVLASDGHITRGEVPFSAK